MGFNVEATIKQIYGSNPIPHLTNLPVWKKWYQGFDETFHKYTVYNQDQPIPCEKYRLGAAATMCELWASLLANEKTYVTIPNGVSDEAIKNGAVTDDSKLQKVLNNTNFMDLLNQGIDQVMGLGGGVFQVALSDAIKDKAALRFDKLLSNSGKINVEFVDAEKTYILKKEYGEIIDVAIVSVGSETANITIHERQADGKYKITDVEYVKKNKDSDDFEERSRHIAIVDTQWFSYLKPNKINKEKIGDVQGVSIYSDSIDQLKFCDDAYDGYHNEMTLSKKRLFISAEIATTIRTNGNTKEVSVFDPKDMLVYILPKGAVKDGNETSRLIAANDSPIRAESYERILNGGLSTLSQKCGFGRNYFTFNPQEGGRPLQTATAVISQNSDLYRNLKKHEKNVCKTIKEITRAICDASQYTADKISKIYNNDEITVLFDDSIIEDKASEKENARKEVAQGIMSKVEYRVEFFGENEETARAELLKNPDYVNELLIKYADPLRNGLITVEQFVDIVYGKDVENKQALIDSITNGMKEREVENNPFSSVL